jgi:hypothetical protein
MQRLFNKRVKYEVNKTFGSDYLAEHQVRELDVKEMLKIRSIYLDFIFKTMIIYQKKNFFN